MSQETVATCAVCSFTTRHVSTASCPNGHGVLKVTQVSTRRLNSLWAAETAWLLSGKDTP